MREYIRRNYYGIKRMVIIIQVIILIVAMCVDDKYSLGFLITLSILSLLSITLMKKKFPPYDIKNKDNEGNDLRMNKNES